MSKSIYIKYFVLIVSLLILLSGCATLKPYQYELYVRPEDVVSIEKGVEYEIFDANDDLSVWGPPEGTERGLEAAGILVGELGGGGYSRSGRLTLVEGGMEQRELDYKFQYNMTPINTQALLNVGRFDFKSEDYRTGAVYTTRWIARSYLKFDLSKLPENASITRAELMLFCKDATNDMVPDLYYSEVDDWLKVYNEEMEKRKKEVLSLEDIRGPIGSVIPLVKAKVYRTTGRFVTTTKPGFLGIPEKVEKWSSGYDIWDVTDIISTVFPGDKVFTFVLKAPGEKLGKLFEKGDPLFARDYYSIDSRSPNKPRLVVQYVTIGTTGRETPKVEEKDVMEKLKELGDMYKKGLLSEEDYNKKKTELLENL
jgi:hypothetical protein